MPTLNRSIECRRCGWTDEHDQNCPKHECRYCGAYGEHHCVPACDVIDCQLCDALDENVRRGDEPMPPLDGHSSPAALKIEQRLADEDRCGWKPRREDM